MTLEALLFDVDGTLAETEEVHRRAFNQAFAEAGLDWHWSRARYRELLQTSGGKERIRRYLREEHPELLARDDLDDWIAALHRAKTAHYSALMAAGEVTLRPGVERLLREARAAGLRLAIATTTTRANIDALFAATLGRAALDWFEVIVAAEQAPVKKPDPSVYRQALAALDLSPHVCLAIEDTRNGVLAARGAGLAVLVTESYYSHGEDFDGALAVLSDLGEPDRPHRVLAGDGGSRGWVTVDDLRRWLAAYQAATAAPPASGGGRP